MRLANSTGTVSKLSGKRRKPWCAKRFIGWRIDDERKRTVPIYKMVGCYEKKMDAYKALFKAIEEAQNDPVSTVTMKQVYNEWSAVHYNKISSSTQTVYEAAWEHLQYLHDRPIAEIRTKDIEDAIEKDDPPRTMRPRCASLLSLLYHYAIAHDYCDKDYSKLADARGDSKVQIVRKVFTPQEVQDLFGKGDVLSDMALVGIYTGMRPNEIINLQNDEVDLKNEFLRIRGSKTKSGHFRDIPLHPDILPIIRRNAAKSGKFRKPRLFLKDDGKPINYIAYHDFLAPHLPHDTRHSFVTYAKRSGMDDLAVKRIVGHSSNRDVTSDVYTHTDDAFLLGEMMKFHVR